MQAVHEAGHVFGAWMTGGHVEKVVLNPLTISRTDLDLNPNPLAVVWVGPMTGIIVPLVLWGLTSAVGLPTAFVLRFFAGCCLIANGAYIGCGSFLRIGDCGEMLRHGSAAWQLWMFGAITVPLGLWLWHKQGRHFGLGAENGKVSATSAYAVMIACLLLLGIDCLVDGR